MKTIFLMLLVVLWQAVGSITTATIFEQIPSKYGWVMVILLAILAIICTVKFGDLK